MSLFSGVGGTAPSSSTALVLYQAPPFLPKIIGVVSSLTERLKRSEPDSGFSQTTSSPKPKELRVFESENVKEDNWLNNGQMWGYLLYLSRKYPFLKIPRTDTFFLRTEPNFTNSLIDYLSKEFSVDESDKVLTFPVNYGNYHWTQVIVDRQNKIIYHFDSFGGQSLDLKKVQLALSFLIPEALEFSLDHPQETMRIQGDGYNCGVYCLAWARSFCYLLKQAGDTPFKMEGVSAGNRPSELRTNLKKVLEGLEKEISEAISKTGERLKRISNELYKTRAESPYPLIFWEIIHAKDQDLWVQDVKRMRKEYLAAPDQNPLDTIEILDDVPQRAEKTPVVIELD